MFEDALNYIAIESQKLAETVTGQKLPLDTITIFSKDDKEYEFLKPLVMQYGPKSSVSHGATLYVDSDFTVQGQRIKYLGLRKPDPSRPQRGYGDYPVLDYADWVKKLTQNPYAEAIKSGRGQPMIEFRHPNFDVLGYLVNKPDH